MASQYNSPYPFSSMDWGNRLIWLSLTHNVDEVAKAKIREMNGSHEIPKQLAERSKPVKRAR